MENALVLTDVPVKKHLEEAFVIDVFVDTQERNVTNALKVTTWTPH